MNQAITNSTIYAKKVGAIANSYKVALAIVFSLLFATPAFAQHPNNLALGGGHTCVLTSNNSVRCWGANGDGQLGDGTTVNRLSPVAVNNLPTSVVALTAIGGITCLRTVDGNMRCWGGNRDGQVGDGTNINRASPVTVSGLSTGVVSMEAGGNSVCAVLNVGAARCWGLNTYGQLGDGTKTSRNAPVNVVGISDATAITVGSFHACAIVAGGRVKCWGRNDAGQLGNGTTTDSTTPVDVNGLSGVVQVIAGSSHNCARLANGTARCWGANNSLQVGSFQGVNQLTPVVLFVAQNDSSNALLSVVSAGDLHSCAVTRADSQIANTIYCVGNNADRQLGSNVNTFAQVGAGFIREGYATIASRGSYNCAIALTGELHCWGRNNDGQLGLGNTTRTGVPTAVPGILMSVPAASTGPTGPSDYTDMWWAGTAENGWGMSIQQHSNGVQFNALYIYDAQGQPRWYVMPGGTWNANFTTYTGAIYQPTGAPLNNYNSAQLAVGAVQGTVTLNFTSAGAMTLSYTINGVSGTKTMSRQSFASGTAPFNVADMWWAGTAENGWGMSIVQQQGALFSVWYTYGLDNKAIWYVMPGGTWNGNVYSGPFFATTGSPWLGATYNPNTLNVTQVGTMRLTFSSATQATLNYTFTTGPFAGTNQTKSISRQAF